ncbi:MAG TPA: AAA family ATPase, partial [Candidatus Binatus sp.]|nr:AAA family ATPase [Candidatus Binatus sp.]
MSGELIARETERLAVEAFLADSSSGPRALVLEGEAGIGKSTLFASAVTAARQRFSFVFASRPDESERSLANVVLGDLFGESPATIREALPAPRRRAFERALLVSNEAVETELDPRALEVAILSILGALTRDGPLLIAIDGDQWADRSSIEALAFAVRRLTDQPLRLLLARRADGGAAPGSGLDLAVSTTAGPGAVERLRLGPLSVGAIQALLRSRVGLTLSRPRLLRLAEASGGNPFFALELARSQPSADPGVPLPVPLSLERMLGGRLDRLDEQTRRGLLLIAAHGRGPRELLERLGVVRTVVERAVGEQVLEVSDHVVRFAHPLLASRVYQR